MSGFRQIPSVDSLIREVALDEIAAPTRARAARAAIANAKTRIAGGESVSREEILSDTIDRCRELERGTLRQAINLSGVILHTGLGRAQLAPKAVSALTLAASGHSTVEFDIESGQRGDRQVHVRKMLCELTEAEDALVVNNNAAAVFLVLSSLCAGTEVILSRGEMVEIGGSFRMPDIVRRSGCQLVEVGCTNKTRLEDYEAAISESTSAILRCHPSNFVIVGFQESPKPEDIGKLCRRNSLQYIDDVGSGCLVDTRKYGVPYEPTIKDSVRSGATVITASGDKLLGGPQAGIIVGTKEAVGVIRKHPIARAVRVDKLTLAALSATLKLYIEGRESEIPVWKYMARSPGDIKKLAMRLKTACSLPSKVVAGFSEVGGGSMPAAKLPTWRLCIESQKPEGLALALRTRGRPVIGRIEDDMLCLDPRTLDDGEMLEVQSSLRSLGT